MLTFSFYYLASALYFDNKSLVDFISICFSVAFYPIFGFFVAKFLFDNKASEQNLFKYYAFLVISVAFLNSIIIIAEFIFPYLRGLVESVLAQGDSNINYTDHPFRLRGISSGGGAALSAFNAYSTFLLFFSTNQKNIKPLPSLIIAATLTMACIFLGRTGLIISIVFLIFIFYTIIKNKFLITSLSLIASILLVAGLFYDDLENYFSEQSEVIGWAFEWVDVLTTDNKSTASTDDLITMLFVPDDVYELFFGVGHFEALGSSFRRTDSGYLKTLMALGLFLTIFLYSHIIQLTLKTTNIGIPRRIPVYIIILFFLIEIKEPFLYQNYASRALFLLIGFSWFQKYKVAVTSPPLVKN